LTFDLPAVRGPYATSRSVTRQPAAAAKAMSDFLDTPVHAVEPSAPGRPALAEPGSWRRALSPAQTGEIEAIAGEELRRVGYGS